jgi:hypothetical protein
MQVRHFMARREPWIMRVCQVEPLLDFLTLSLWFIKTLALSPYSSKTWSPAPSKSLASLDQGRGDTQSPTIATKPLLSLFLREPSVRPSLSPAKCGFWRRLSLLFLIL